MVDLSKFFFLDSERDMVEITTTHSTPWADNRGWFRTDLRTVEMLELIIDLIKIDMVSPKTIVMYFEPHDRKNVKMVATLKAAFPRSTVTSAS